jgi:hypothetical protein
MTWKGTAASSLLSIAAMSWWGVVSQPAAPEPTPAVSRSAAAAAAPSEIEREARKLQERLHPANSYEPPSRNPFRFGAAPAAVRPRASAPPAVVPHLEPPPSVTEPPRMSLAGIATDTVEGATIRTAIVSTPAGVQMVKEGDVLEPGYRVRAIEDEAVDLVGGDGAPRRLTLSNAR